VRSDGAFRIADTYPNPGCMYTLWSQGTVQASHDYDLLYSARGAYDGFYEDQQPGFVLATTIAGPDGLIVEDSTGTSAPVRFSAFEFDQSVGTSVQFQVP
jgi:hypothetical protein